jgi:hypothetical protein
MIKDFVLPLVLKRLVKKTEGYSTDKMLSYYGSIRERVYANLMLIIIALFSTVNYGFTVGFTKWSLFVVLGVIIIGLAVSVFYHAVLYLQLRNYLNFMFKPITDDLERPENYFKRLLPNSEVSISPSTTSSTEDKSEPSEVVETENQSETEGK